MPSSLPCIATSGVALPDHFSLVCEAVTTIFCVEIAATLAMHCAGQAALWSGLQWPVACRFAAVMVSLPAEFQMVKILIHLRLMRCGVEHFFLYCKTASKCILCHVRRVQDSRTGSLWTCRLHIVHRQGHGKKGPNMPNHLLEEPNSAVRGATGSCKWVTFRAGWPTCLHLSREGLSYSKTVPDTLVFDIYCLCFVSNIVCKSMADTCLLTYSFVTCGSWRVKCFNLTNPILKTSAIKDNSFCDSLGKSQNLKFGMPSILFEIFETSSNQADGWRMCCFAVSHRGLVLERKLPLGFTIGCWRIWR